ncbi:MAG TPA: protein kinase [Candidatus Hydrogenedentes bacterium]|nr:protein kinase [Candidatus Hydrogenedentota bacterium]
MAKVKCPRCFHVNPDGQETCIKCNTSLPKIKIEAGEPPAPLAPLPNALQLRRGQVVAKRYTVLNLIGRGGMGCIYKVHDNILSEDVALKTLLPQFVQDKLVVERFFNEARIARRLAHANIVRVHDIGTAENVVYISMEFLQGKSLRSILEGLPPGQRLPIKQTLRIIDELCNALEYAHQFTIHRDIKPENIMVGMDGSIKLMDFGISKLMDNNRLTGASIVMGTPFYMSPEQVRNSRDVDARSDIYSIGVVLYEILTGNVPTGVPRPASQIMRDIPQALDAIVAKCVEPDPQNRYANVSELRAALRPIIEYVETGVSAQATPKQLQAAPSRTARPLVGAVLALLVILAMTGGMFGLESRRKALLSENTPAIVSSLPTAAKMQFPEMKSLLDRIRARASMNAKLSDTAQLLFDEGDKQWAVAQTEIPNSPENALAEGFRAAEYYLAALLIREGMVFVPSGTIDINGVSAEVPAFLIDMTEVTIGQFRTFCQNVNGGWRFPPELHEITDDTLPITFVSYYDAQACAAWQHKQLPTEAEWARAAYGAPNASKIYPWGETWQEGASNMNGAENSAAPAKVMSFEKDRTWAMCYDMAGNVAEWTRSPMDANAPAVPSFGSLIAVRGGHFLSQGVPLNNQDARLFETREAALGFRCVIELPKEPVAIVELINRT